MSEGQKTGWRDFFNSLGIFKRSIYGEIANREDCHTRIFKMSRSARRNLKAMG